MNHASIIGVSRVRVLLAAAVVVVLGGLLGVRLIVGSAPVALASPPPAADVADPSSFDPAALEVPCWSCPSAKSWPVRFRTDLDRLAPLGDGPANAAEFFAAFEKHRGPRAADAEAMQNRRVERADDIGMVVAPDDALLLEAEPWVDQATMNFYPDVFPMEGAGTRITNLLVMLTMARSWTARGVDADDPERGLDDCRRAIRLGRLLRQDDVIIINDLVGLACIHIGTRGVYRIAQRDGDLGLALLASVVLGEVAPQRMMTAKRISTVDLAPFIRRGDDGRYRLDVPDAQVDALVSLADEITERRFFGEVIMTGAVILNLGTPDQQHRVRAMLDELASRDDPIIADFAQWALTASITDKELAEWYPHPMER
ncbi:MAG: hypothetical protein PVG53_03070 [Holophagae bacterium]|jgi:hypothetical protein